MFLQSPAESLTTDSRPGSVMDEGESNSEPPESMIMVSKDTEEKDPLSIALPETSSDNLTKDDHVANEMSPSNVVTPEDEADIPAQSSKTVPDDEIEQDKQEKSVSSPPEQQSSSQSSNSNENNPPNQMVKDQEILSKLANMKQEVKQEGACTPTTANSQVQSQQEFTAKQEPMYIKEEPNDELSTIDPNNSQEAHDLKVKVEVKTEQVKNNASNNENSSNNLISNSDTTTNNQMPNDQDRNNNNSPENLVCKPQQMPSAFESKYNPELRSGIDGADAVPKYGTEGQLDYSMKSEMKRDTTTPGTPGEAPLNMKYPDVASSEHPPEMLRHPYEHGAMKYEQPPASQPQDLKFMQTDSKYPPSDSSIKSQFSTDNLMKGSSHYGVPSSGADLPIDASSRVTPNQDSQGSNSNSQPATLPSPSTSQPPIAAPTGMFAGPHGLNLSSSAHLPANHPSLMTSTGGPLPPSISAGTPGSGLQTSSGSSPFLPISSVQPTNLSSLHRPHTDIPTSNAGGGIRIGYPPSSVPTSTVTSSSAFGPGPQSIYSSSRLSERDGLHAPHRTSPLGPMLHGSPHPLISHPLPLHLGHPGMGLPPHHPAHLAQHLHGHLMQPLGAGPNTPLPLIGGPPSSSNPLTSLMEAAAGRRTPTSAASSTAQSTSLQNSVIQSPAGSQNLGQSLSRTSPLVSSIHHHPSSGAFTHRPQSPSNPTNLSRTSPLHLGQSQGSLGSSSSAIAAQAERDRQLLRQQSPHMTPPPTSQSSLISSPLSKIYGPGQRPSSPPPHHFRPGASPPVVRHPQMPLALPLMGPSALQSQVMHPSQAPYPHHLLHPSMFYSPHNPFNSPYPYSPYGPSFAYMKPPTGSPLDGGPMLAHHPTSIPPPRSDEPPSPHANGPKSVTSMQDKIKSPAPSSAQTPIKTPQNNNSNNTQGSNPSTPTHGPYGPPSGPSALPYPPSHPFMENTLPPGKTSHIEALRAHAASAALSGGHHHHHHQSEPVQIDTLEIDPDPEPPSPVQPTDRGPSPEAKPDDTECHRSQSAM